MSDDPLSPPVGICFMAGSVTSANLEELIAGYEISQGPAYEDLVLLFKASNPHLEFFNSNTHGYNLLEITPGSLTCTMKAVNTVLRPEAVLNTLRVFRVEEGSNTIQDVTVQSVL